MITMFSRQFNIQLPWLLNMLGAYTREIFSALLFQYLFLLFSTRAASDHKNESVDLIVVRSWV